MGTLEPRILSSLFDRMSQTNSTKPRRASEVGGAKSRSSRRASKPSRFWYSSGSCLEVGVAVTGLVEALEGSRSPLQVREVLECFRAEEALVEDVVEVLDALHPRPGATRSHRSVRPRSTATLAGGSPARTLAPPPGALPPRRCPPAPPLPSTSVVAEDASTETREADDGMSQTG